MDLLLFTPSGLQCPHSTRVNSPPPVSRKAEERSKLELIVFFRELGMGLEIIRNQKLKPALWWEEMSVVTVVTWSIITFICTNSVVFSGPHSHLLPLFNCQISQAFQAHSKFLEKSSFNSDLFSTFCAFSRLQRSKYSLRRVSFLHLRLGEAEMLFGQLWGVMTYSLERQRLLHCDSTCKVHWNVSVPGKYGRVQHVMDSI